MILLRHLRNFGLQVVVGRLIGLYIALGVIKQRKSVDWAWDLLVGQFTGRRRVLSRGAQVCHPHFRKQLRARAHATEIAFDG